MQISIRNGQVERAQKELAEIQQELIRAINVLNKLR
jgi:hypothetical protein